MDHYTQYLHYHVDLLKEFKVSVQQHSPFSNKEQNLLREEEQEFINVLQQLCELTHYTETASEQGQWMVSRVVGTYSHLMPSFARDLLWFFGGDCLHYMPDEEIDFYQKLDELRFAAEEAGDAFDYAEAKRKLSTVTPYNQS